MPIIETENAYPLHPAVSSEATHRNGLTKREYYAIRIMQGMNACLTESSNWPSSDGIKKMAANAVEQADALIEALI